ncbi:helix-turn-helix domain-containing protein [Alicyclobacillus fodiniaquatilis]|jgi:AraC-like DNA-binding protein|uniref:Helix-turn-helix domain-containing protein n=1 Tax=Alicyclobacillus fodiniaquatilis TaxID=1661150 RepID=A0ABW4JK73_9BACL
MYKTDYLTNRILTQNTVYVQYRKTAKAPNITCPHRHYGYEIYYFQNGEATYIIGDKIYTLLPGDMLLFRGDISHHVNPSERRPYLRSILNFREEYMGRVLHPFVQERMKQLFNSSSGERLHWSEQESGEIEHLFSQIAQEEREQKLGHQDMTNALLTILILWILRKNEESITRSHLIHFQGQRETNVERALRVINKQFRKRMSLEDIAAEVHLNKHYLCHCFKQVTGLTINQYLTKLRIDEAKKLITETSKPIGIIAEEIGVGGVAQFSRLFRQYTGVSPRAYRQGDLR